MTDEARDQLGFSETLGRLLRKDRLDQLGVGTPRRIEALIDTGHHEEAKRMTQYFRKEFEVVHDIYARYVQDLLQFIAERLGEDQVEAAFRSSLEGWFKERYDVYNKLSLEEKVQLTAEGMRCHLDGPERQGVFLLMERKDP